MATTVLPWTRSIFVCLFWVGFYPGDDNFGGTMADTRLEFSNAGQPTKENSILSLFCKIWGLQINQHNVGIVRQLPDQMNHSEILTLDENIIMADDGNRAFLAKRTLSDGSVVYLLSLLGVSRKDAGDYTCEITTHAGGWVTVTSQTVRVDIQYLPEGRFPLCVPDAQPLTVTWGRKKILSCRSELSVPPVSLTWSLAGSDDPLPDGLVQNSESGGYIYSNLSVTPLSTDRGAVFVCKITSSAFPGNDPKQCYIGPLTIEGTPETTTVTIATPTLPLPDIRTTIIPGTEECIDETQCAFFSPEAMPWIAASVAGGIVAVMFFMIAIILLIQLRQIKASAKARRKVLMEVVNREGPYDLPYDTIQRARYADDDSAYIAAISRARIRANADVKNLHMVREESHYDDLPARPPATSGVATVSQLVLPPEPPRTPRKENLI